MKNDWIWPRTAQPWERAAGAPAPGFISSELPCASPDPAEMGLEGPSPHEMVDAVWWGEPL